MQVKFYLKCVLFITALIAARFVLPMLVSARSTELAIAGFALLALSPVGAYLLLRQLFKPTKDAK